MLKWWWVGAFGAFMKRRSGRARAAAPPPENVALVVGSTLLDIVGAALLDILPLPDTPGGPWKVYALSRRPLPPWSAALPPAVFHHHLDLADPAAVADALAPLTDISHVFYVTWDPRPTHGEGREANGAMLRNVLSAIVPNCPGLLHVCLQTSRKHYVDLFEPLSGAPLALRPYSEDLPRLDCPDLEDVLLDGLASSRRVTSIFGFSPRSARNAIASLCVYAAICRKEGLVLRWPGSRVAWEGFSDASDAELVAEHALWAAMESNGKNEPFNCSNGDIFKWQQLWPILANQFGVEWTGYPGEDQRFMLEEAMAGKEGVWSEIVNENGLVETELNEITNWGCIDGMINMERENLDTMNKSMEYGFFGFWNKVRFFNTWIDKVKVDKIVP
ncbi:(S)-8-oxocitronellyl enol synthase ISY1-like [Triticum dicoccoides]|uniref:(S)-8-oxocitronellyl enol synthase ISY1-like n=1 Tax=Triticum dicoccoides TaxID=85692 RepID=UPI00162B3093|nr:(S)-8-oxocitronellyl enol synthase ISY1-like [Triticum dicoccoides]